MALRELQRKHDVEIAAFPVESARRRQTDRSFIILCRNSQYMCRIGRYGWLEEELTRYRVGHVTPSSPNQTEVEVFTRE